MIQNIKAEILASRKIGHDIFLLKLNAPSITETAQPGQFVHIRCSETTDPLLRRPISIHDINSDGELTLIYHVKGKGTSWLSKREAGKKLDILGPIGRGFTLTENKRVALVAGGLGSIPLFFLAKKAAEKNNEVDFFIGAQSKGCLLRIDELKALNINLYIATDDGSEGFKGFITQLWEQYLKNGKVYDRAYSCGPKPQMAAFSRLAIKASLPAEVSLEENMACGIGACRGCVTTIQDSYGNKHYENVCTCGPVFDATTVCWGD
ncbi:MAG: dihydroorotate dehydrogenase electron transfer subunit [Clostridia bacterium]|nr:dihydroorotate dehydrogenase electron transfer subunit [Clostridia bacterium]